MQPRSSLFLAFILLLAACGVTAQGQRVAPPSGIVLAPSITPITPSSTPAATPSATPPVPTMTSATLDESFDGFTAYRVHFGDTLERIAAQGGSTVAAIRTYNRLEGAAQVGRELIVPRLAGRTNTLPPKWLIVERGNTRKPWVALTLDCGGRNPRTHDLLATLRAAHIHLTFFLLGESIVEDPALLRQMVADGHELASHSFTHADFTTLTDEQIADELQRTERAVHAIVGPQVSIRPYFRFPYGAYDKRTLRTVIANGYMPIHWTLDSLDQMGDLKTPDYIAERLTTKLSDEQLPGAILLSHCTGATADALPGIIAGLKARGVELRTLSDVLGP